MTHSILVVDDVPDNVKLIAYDLEDAGYEVLTARNGKEAVDILRAQGPRIVLTDWMMPEMDGLELCRAIREAETGAFTYVIMLTAFADQFRLVDAFEAGADDFLAKPFDRPELMARLKAGTRIVELEARLAAERRALHKANAELAVANEKLMFLAETDELTGLGNRREAMRFLRSCWTGFASRRHNGSLSAIMIDMDHFKRCNDRHGHDFGDAVLRETAKTLISQTGVSERTFRMGGEEFLIVCPRLDEKACAALAERLRDALESKTVRHRDRAMNVTASLGVASATSSMADADDLLRAADRALYDAKQKGRNCVCIASPQEAANVSST